MWQITNKYLVDLLKKNYKEDIKEISAKNYEILLDTMKKLGNNTKNLIETMKSFDDNESLKPEKITDEYVNKYKKELVKLMANTKQNLIQNINSLSSDMVINIQNTLKNWERELIKFTKKHFSNILSKEDKGILMRVHGDFHLAQAIQEKNGNIKFTDFAGEPSLSFTERKNKHSYMYDIAGMYRSITGYLPVIVAKTFASEDGNINNKKLVWAIDIIKPIINNLAKTFTNELEIDKDWLNIEICRRNLYEINYEISYRPNMLFVPIDNLKELLIEE